MAANRELLRLHGRQAECETLAKLVDGVRGGGSAALVVCGKPGTGKTALLDFTAGLATNLQVVRAAGAKSETELAFAGLHRLCGTMLDLLGRLPGPQREALEIAFGMRAGTGPDRFLVGLAVLGLLAESAADRPLMCVIDDAHWLDQASRQALGFAARRLTTESLLVIFAAPEPIADLSGLPTMALGGLRDADARDLLASVVRWPIDDRVRDQILAEAGGIPGRCLACCKRYRQLSSPAASDSLMRCPAAHQGPCPLSSASFLPRPASCFSSRRLTPLAIRHCCGGRPHIWESAVRPRSPRRRPA